MVISLSCNSLRNNKKQFLLRRVTFSMGRLSLRQMNLSFLVIYVLLFLLLRSVECTIGASGSQPLLAPCLSGIGKFSHLIDLDFMADLMNYLRKLAGGGGSSENGSHRLTVSERLQCCIVAFKVMRNNLDALNVDLQEFFVQLYGLILEYRPGR